MRLKKRLIKTGGVIMKLFLLFIFGWPFFWMISTSLQTIDEVNRVTPTFFPAVLQFHNYLDAWHSGPAGGMWIYLKNSIIVVLSVILLQMLVVVPAAYAFAKYEFKGKKIMFGSILIALMMPTQITFLPVYLMMSKWGLINSLLPQILPFITNAFAIFLLRQYFMQVENELIEAAKLDGANRVKEFVHVTLPLLIPSITTAVVTNLIGGFKLFDAIVAMSNGGPNRKSMSLSFYISQLYFNDEKAGYASAVGIMTFFIIMIVALPVNAYLRKKEVEY